MVKEPSNYNEAVKSEEGRSWTSAMEDECELYVVNGTCDLVGLARRRIVRVWNYTTAIFCRVYNLSVKSYIEKLVVKAGLENAKMEKTSMDQELLKNLWRAKRWAAVSSTASK